MLSRQVFKTLTSLQIAELSPTMKCSTVSASEIGKQVTSLQQWDKEKTKVITQSEKSRVMIKGNDQEHSYLAGP